jgi:molybdate transport system permease protein
MELSPILISLKTAGMSIAFAFVLGTLSASAVAFMRNSRAKLLIDGLLTVPLVFPPTVTGFLLLLLFGVRRPIGKILLDVFAVRIVFAWEATVLAAFAVSFPLMYRSARAAIEQVDYTLIEAAKTIGMKGPAILLRVVYPIASPGLVSGGILAFARGLGEFGATAMIAGNIAGKTQTMPLAIYSDVAAGNMDRAMQYTLLLSILSFLAVAFMNWAAEKAIRKPGGHK